MALNAEQQINAHVDRSWNEFEKNYQFEKKFGLDALVDKISRENKSQGLSKVTTDYVIDLLGAQLNKDLTNGLELAYQARQAEMTPRARQKPEQVNENRVDQNLTSDASKKLPPWPGADKIDFASNPSIRQAAEIIANAVNNPNADRQEMTTAYDKAKDDLRNELKNQYKNRLAARMQPSRPAPKPDRP